MENERTEVDSRLITKDIRNTNCKPVVYATYYPKIRQIAIDHGYNLAIHGSMTRDFDLVAVAWVDEPKPYMDMIRAIHNWVGWNFIEEKDFWNSMTITQKPHGRVAVTIQTGMGGYLDISIIPSLKENKAITHEEKQTFPELTSVKEGLPTERGWYLTVVKLNGGLTLFSKYYDGKKFWNNSFNGWCDDEFTAMVTYYMNEDEFKKLIPKEQK